MNLQELEIKIKKIFRPDLNLPMHTRRRIFKIYKFEFYKDLEEVVERFRYNEDKFKYFVDIKDVN